MTGESVVDQIENDPASAVALVGASSTRRAAELLRLARDRGGVSGDSVAQLLGVTAGRVSQVINGDGNIHVSTLARYLKALGYQLKVEAVSLDGTKLEVSRGGRKPRRPRVEETSGRDATTASQPARIAKYGLDWAAPSGMTYVRVDVRHHSGDDEPPVLCSARLLNSEDYPAIGWRVETESYETQVNAAVEGDVAPAVPA